ncbi:isochorismatase [Streptomyces sp. ISL-98]|uniref:phosphopantetheine-binding protein n=1 Tax=Streptomyces sp. ISL-98 TaxID=2819192 RepID=UPI001BE9242D|nr:phosphopantetheine-binding protein [Streptomyces sp. ISL-98]MBT2507486.1 isochorismatase [Streptomyces sp. ISL-98]
MTSAPTLTPEEIREAVATVLGIAPEEIADDANLAQLGLKSIQLMRLSGRWRRSGLDVDFATLAVEPTVRAWARHLGLDGNAPSEG